MTLDMPTVSLVSIAVTAILGFILGFAWWQERRSALAGWWGLALLVMSLGIVIAVAGLNTGIDDVHALGQACVVLSGAIMWTAVRQFEGRLVRASWVFAAPVVFMLAQLADFLDNFDDRLIVTCSTLAAFSLATAFELARNRSEPLVSRWPAIVFLIATGVGYLAWLPLTVHMPIREAGLMFASTWMPWVILVATLERVALAFVVLAMVKEREELKQRIDALTDPLTGLPNRRALFAAAEKLREHSKYLKGDPLSVLVFDLDHFKKINDTFGHRLGDRVLQLFASTMSERLETGSIVGRLGGEEFAAILPGADLATAGVTAEKIRIAFAESAAVFDGARLASTVSIGVASSDDIDCDLSALFHRADGALYTAKNSGRNRVELISSLDALNASFLPIRAVTTAANTHFTPGIEKRAHTRRYRRARLSETGGSRPRRGPPLS
jgi:diguanylate cyclase (GGDEF)-like protein